MFLTSSGSCSCFTPVSDDLTRTSQRGLLQRDDLSLCEERALARGDPGLPGHATAGHRAHGMAAQGRYEWHRVAITRGGSLG